MVQLNHLLYLPLLSISFYLGNSFTKVALAGHLKILNIATHHSIKKLASPFIILVFGGDGHPTLLQNCGHKHIRNNSQLLLHTSTSDWATSAAIFHAASSWPSRIIATSWPQHPKSTQEKCIEHLLKVESPLFQIILKSISVRVYCFKKLW